MIYLQNCQEQAKGMIFNKGIRFENGVKFSEPS